MFAVMTLGQLREKLKDLPDETIVVGEFEEEFKYNEIGDVKILDAGMYVGVLQDGEPPQIYDMPAVVILYGGQIVNAEFALDDRFDQYIDHPREG